MSATAAPPVRRALFGPRYSLRLLLIAFTAFAIGFPIWYRWPYRVADVTSGKLSPFAPPGVRSPTRMVVTTLQRQWGGGLMKHGPESTYLDGKLLMRATYQNDLLHGPYEIWRLHDGIHEAGQYLEGKKEGEWRLLDGDGKLLTSAEWHDDRLDGRYVIIGDKGERVFQFKQGRLVGIDGAPVEDHFGELLVTNRIDNRDIANALASTTEVEFVETPLRDAMHFMMERHEIPIVVDPWHASPMQPLTNQLKGIHLAGALQILLSPVDHACDYRYGMLWITSAADAQDWKDPTGVADIVPPKGSQLARSWNEPVDVEAIKLPLADVIQQQFIARLAIDVDVSQIQPKDESEAAYLVTGRLKGFPFKHGLGMFLYNARCRCELRGETLVILPQAAPADLR